MNAIYVAHDRESGRPVLAVAEFKDIQKALDEYCGADREIPEAKLIRFHPYVSKYASDYVGHYEYLCGYHDTPRTSIFHIHCVDFYTKNSM
jgi:hypothetical protein